MIMGDNWESQWSIFAAICNILRCDIIALNTDVISLCFLKSILTFTTGDSQPMDVCSVHNENSFLRYSVSLLGYGFYGDVLTYSERKRWMGPARYDISGTQEMSQDWNGRFCLSAILQFAMDIIFLFFSFFFPGVKTFLSHRYYEGTVSFLPAEGNLGTPRDKMQCRSG